MAPARCRLPAIHSVRGVDVSTVLSQNLRRRPPGQPLSVIQRWLAPLVVFCLSRTVDILAGAKAGVDPWSAREWAHWDSGLYLEIALKGYYVSGCSHSGKLTCSGNAGWLPGYSWLIRALTWLTVPAPLAGAIISAVCFFSLLALLWFVFLDAKLTPSNCGCLLLAGFFPGQIYGHAVFPLSLCLLFSLLCLHFARDERWWQAGVAGAVAAFSYSTGFLLAAVVVAGSALGFRRHSSKRHARQLGTAVLVATGFALALLVGRCTVGYWDAFFRVQAQYGHGFHAPFAIIGRRIQAALHGDAAAQQTFFAWGLVLLCVMSALETLRRKRWRGLLEIYLIVYTVSYLILPYFIGGDNHSFYRNELLLLPCVLLLRRLEWPVFVPLLLIATYESFVISQLFFRNILV